MAEKLGFDLPSNFAHAAVTELVADSEQFHRAHEMLTRTNRILAVGEEVVRRAAANALPGSESYFGLGARLYALTFGYAEPAKANSGVFNSFPGDLMATSAGMELLGIEAKGGFYQVATSSLEAMKHHSPELADFLQRLSTTMTAGEDNPAERAQQVSQGAALMRYVHLRGKHGLIKAHLSE